MSKKIIVFLLVLFTILTFSLHLYKNSQTPCVNADEAAFGYNAYSLLKTGRDEYGAFLPLRLKSFGDYKLPLYAYLSIPFIALFGLNELSTRVLSIIVGSLFPLLVFFASKELFKNHRAAIIAAFLTSISLWIQTISRQAHEATLAAFFITLALVFFLRFSRTHSVIDCVFFSLSIGLSLFSYHISRLFGLFFFFLFLVLLVRNRRKIALKKIFLLVIIVLVPLSFFLFSELKYPAVRVKNLIFYRNQGFGLKLDELKTEHNISILHNRVLMGLTDLSHEYIKYFSPQFLVVAGDANPRFGWRGISPLSLIEYLFFLIGVFYLFQRKEKKRYLIMLLLLISPLTASLAWQEYSLTRSYYLIVPITLIVGYGISSCYDSVNKNRHKKLLIGTLVFLFVLSNLSSWDFYFFHYPKRALAIRSFQCGYKELAQYVGDNYDRFRKFHVTPRHGEPYIFLLYFLKFDPARYQRMAYLSASDEYGFGQVERFDKFDFNFTLDIPPKKGVSYVGYPENFINNVGIDTNKIKKIKIRTEDIFLIYEGQ